MPRTLPATMYPTRGLAVSLALCCLSVASVADTQIVSKVSFKVVNQPAPGDTSQTPPTPSTAIPDQTITAFYKGGNARTEVEDGPITIYNGKEGKVYILDPKLKTYFVLTYNEFLAPHVAVPGSGSTNAAKASAQITVSAGDGSRTCAGLDSKVYVISGTVTLTHQHNSSGGGGRGGGLLGSLGGFGGFGGRHGGGGRSGNSEPGVPPKKLEISGEYWISDKLKLPDDKNATPLPAIYSSTEIQNFVFRPLADGLIKRKTIPLDSRIAVTSTENDGSQRSVTRTSRVTSVTQQPLPDALFQLPVGYTQIASPKGE